MMNDSSGEMNTGSASLSFLGGGKSTRFGPDKSLLQWNGRTIIETLQERIGDLFEESFVVSDRGGKFHFSKIREITDIYPERGPLGGLHAGLCAAKTEYLFLLACDIPSVGRELVSELLTAARSGTEQAVIPIHTGGFEPLCSVFRKDTLPVVEHLLETGNSRVGLIELIESITVRYYPTDCDFINLNYQEDVDRFFEGAALPERRRKKRYLSYYETEFQA